MDCFPDYCLACDKQIVDGLYCSQACRLADLERAGSTPTSPLTPLSVSLASAQWDAASLNDACTFQLAPASDFAPRTSSPVQGRLNSSISFSSPFSSQPGTQQSAPQHTYSAPVTPRRSLTPSSSRSSLSSNSSSLHSLRVSGGLSEEAKNELKSYFDSFDHIRERRRRSFPIPQQAVHACGSALQRGMTPVRGYDDEQ